MRRDHPFTDYRQRRVTVMGLGSFGGGLGAVQFLAVRGARVTVTDLRPADQLPDALHELSATSIERWRLGEHHPDDFTSADLVVVNPAVKPDHPLIQLCQARGVPLTSEMNLFVQQQRGTLIGVTGSNGKSTTTALLHNILRQTGRRCWLGGNLGKSLLPEVEQIQPGDLVVLELSSFQLAGLQRLQVSPHVSVVTNFSPNHLDWHGTLEHYRHAKQTILRWQTANDFSVVNAADADLQAWTSAGQRLEFGGTDRGQEGAFDLGTACLIRSRGHESQWPLRDWLQLPGRHNLANALAATAAACSLGADREAVQRGLETYQPLPHRLQFVGEIDGRRCYNDSLATTPESALVALDAFDAPILLIAGGYDKQVDLSELARGIATRTKGVALIGQTAAILRDGIALQPDASTLVAPPLSSLRAAVAWTVDKSAPGDVILLSPGCASYDWFSNFADRGDQFTRLVNEWASAAPQPAREALQ